MEPRCNSEPLYQLIGDYVAYKQFNLDIQRLQKYIISVTPQQLYKLIISVTDSFAQTVIHLAAWRDDHNAVTCILELFTHDERYELMAIRNKWGNPAIHYAAYKGYTETMRCLLEPLAPEQRCELMKMQGQWGNTAIHNAAWFGHIETLRCMLDFLAPDNQLLDILNDDNQKAIDITVKYNQIATTEFIRQYRSTGAPSYVQEGTIGQLAVQLQVKEPQSANLFVQKRQGNGSVGLEDADLLRRLEKLEDTIVLQNIQLEEKVQQVTKLQDRLDERDKQFLKLSTQSTAQERQIAKLTVQVEQHERLVQQNRHQMAIQKDKTGQNITELTDMMNGQHHQMSQLAACTNEQAQQITRLKTQSAEHQSVLEESTEQSTELIRDIKERTQTVSAQVVQHDRDINKLRDSVDYLTLRPGGEYTTDSFPEAVLEGKPGYGVQVTDSQDS